MKMKNILTLVMALLCAEAVCAANMSLSDARAQIGKCIGNPATMTSVVKQLAVADQTPFLTEVNAAIGEMPGSAELKAATYLDANRAAVRAAGAGNKTAMIAEVFATVPPEAMTVVNEIFAKELLSRDNGPSKKVTDGQYMKVATNVMSKVNGRCASADNSGVRAAFAVLMLIRADNGKIENLTETLIKTLPNEVQEVARTEWIPPALGIGQEKTYEPMLVAVEKAVQLVENDVVIRLVGPQLLESLLCELVEGTPLVNNSEQPFAHGDGVLEADPRPRPVVDPSKIPDFEPQPYNGQKFGE